jgi:hypothetical protein
MRGAMQAAGVAFALDWKNNARATSGEHGKHYPDSITANLALTVTTVSVDVGPDRAKKQGSMGRGFEFGSKNQPPHLDGLRAMDRAAYRAEATIAAAMGKVFDGAAG